MHTNCLNLFQYIRLICLTLVFIPGIASSQVENVPAEHPVYPFLKKMQVEGIIKNYNDVILPLSKGKIINYLLAVDSLNAKLSKADKEFLIRMKDKFGLNDIGADLFENFPAGFSNNIFQDHQKNFYSYKDSLTSFYINPVFISSLIYSDRNKAGSTLLSFGGKAYGSYDNWLGFYIEGTNGLQFGNRNTASIDPEVKQSYTFNKTKLNNFDGTKGYLRLQKGIASIQFGRERIIWGNGYINKLLLSENPPLFDFIKFDISYKSFSYNFIHGWLEQKPALIHIDSIGLDIKQKNPKYFAISRFGYTPSGKLSLGISQVIVYSNRPFEAAYLNPFLFWESAQRSMGDLDNSMLSFDGRYLITNGMEVNGTLLFDDINFKRIGQGRWIDNTNGSAWQVGIYAAAPLLPDNLDLKLEYMQLRPYMFSHPGVGEALTFTNNGYLLGTDIQPNSVLLSVEADYRFSGKLSLSLKYNHYLHGNNVYDSNGNLVENFGGNVFNYLAWYNPQDAYLLKGIRERVDEAALNLDFEITYGFYLDLQYIYRSENTVDLKGNNNVIWGSFKLELE